MTKLCDSIKALIFDFGGVLMRSEDPEPRERMARELGLSLSALEEIVFNSEAGQLAEVGSISSEARWRQVTLRLGLKSPDAWLTFPRRFFSGEALDTQLIEHIRHLHRTYRTALLSNASESLDEYVRGTLGLGEVFDAIVISALVGTKKPDPHIYQVTLDRLGVAPHEAVFVDDRRENVEGADALGIHSFLFTTPQALLDDLKAVLRPSAFRS